MYDEVTRVIIDCDECSTYWQNHFDFLWMQKSLQRKQQHHHLWHLEWLSGKFRYRNQTNILILIQFFSKINIQIQSWSQKIASILRDIQSFSWPCSPLVHTALDFTTKSSSTALLQFIDAWHQWRTQNIFMGGVHSVAYGGHLYLVCAVCDVAIWRHIHVFKSMFWRSLLT